MSHTLQPADMDRIVNILVRLRDILDNTGAAKINADTFFYYSIDKSVATDFSDGKLRLGLALDTNFGIPLGLLTPFGRINLSEGGFVNQTGISNAFMGLPFTQPTPTCGVVMEVQETGGRATAC